MARIVTVLLGLMAPMLTTAAPLSVAFSPGGLLFPYYIGVGYELRALGLITPSTPLAGASAGSIIAAALACDVPEETVLSALSALLSDVRSGTKLNVAVPKALRAVMDDNSYLVAAERGLTVGYFEVLPRPGGRLVSSWSSTDDLIECICASCNWPFFYSRWPFVWCRNSLTLDGFFAVGRERFGCAPLDSERELAVTALPKVGLEAYDDINIIQPDRFEGLALPVSDSEWFQWALKPAPDEMIDKMVALGRSHAKRWRDTSY